MSERQKERKALEVVRATERKKRTRQTTKRACYAHILQICHIQFPTLSVIDVAFSLTWAPLLVVKVMDSFWLVV